MSDIQRTYRVLIDTELYDSVESIDNPIGEIAQDEVVEIIEPNLGNYFQFSKVEYDGQEVFLRSCFLTPEEGTPSTYEVTGLREIVSTLEEIKIKDAKIAIPYIESGKVNVVLDCATVLKNELAERMADLKLQAFECIFQYYGKVYTEAQANEFCLNPFGLVEVSEPHFPARPGFNILTKFSIKKAYIEAYPDLSFEQFSIDNIHKNYIAVSINLSGLESVVRDVVKTLENYDKQISKFEGQLIGINYKNLSVRMRKFLSEFKKFLTINGVVDYGNNPDASVELGFNINTFRLEYVVYFANAGKFLRIGMPPMADSVDRRLAKLLISHRDILSAARSGIDWQQFSKNYFSGEYKIIFTPPALQAPNLKLPTSQIKTNIDKLTADFNDLSFMDVEQNMGLSSLKLDPKFKTSASELVLRSRDVVGDNFLINLPDILENVEDLNSLYGLVFDKVSVKDLVDIMMEQMAANLNLPDINEIKLRGIMKALSPDIAIDLISQFATDEFKLSKLGLSICDVYSIGKEQIDDLLSNFQVPIVPIELYFIHYDVDGELAGMLAERFQGDLTAALEENGINDCVGLMQSLANGKFKISDYFQEQAIGEVICQILSEGLPRFENPCPEIGVSNIPRLTLSDLRLDILDVFKGIKPSILIKGIDGFAKGAFADAKKYQEQLDIQSSGGTPDFSGIDFQISPGQLFGEFTKIPKIKIELDKINLTKKKMLNKAPNLDIDLEFKKKDVSFNLPSKKSVNPSFDFASFQFGSIGDIFGGAVTSIEDALKEGIEKALVAVFKGILINLLDSVNQNTPDIDSPDFGGLNMNDLLDASDGANSNTIAELALGSINLEISKFKFDPDLKGCSAREDITEYSPTKEDVKNALNDISDSMKPMELTRVMKGLRNSKDFANMRQAITDPMMREAFAEDVFNEVMDIVTDYVDIGMLETLEGAYGNKEVMVSVCNDRGIPYNLRGIKDNLADKYKDLTDDELNDLIDSIVDETKNSLIDAIGSLKDNFNDNLPFDEDPCSFMPKQSDIPAMDFANDVTFNTIFDPIELEYKSEATTFPDLMMQTSPSDEYVKLRLKSLDVLVDTIEQNPDTGLYKINYVYVKDKFPDIDDSEGIYNQDFGNNYFGSQTTLYYKDANGLFHSSSVSKVKKDEILDEWLIATASGDAIDQNIYVRKQDEKMSPMPELRDVLAKPEISIQPPGIILTDAFTAQYSTGYSINFNSLAKRDKLIAPSPHGILHMSTAFTSPTVQFDRSGNSITLITPNPQLLVSQECTSSPKETTSDRDLSYVDGVKQAINSMSQQLLGINADSFFFADNGTERITTADYLSNEDLVANVTLEVAKLMSKTFSTAPLFEQDEMLSFLFDTEDVNLLKAQEAKKSAKDEFNEECDFTDDNNSKLKSSSIKKLIELTVRVYIIDKTIKACFANSIAYEDEASDYFIEQLYETMSSELELQKNSYFSLFKEEYKKEFGEELSADGEIGEKFKEMVRNIYADVASNFETIFPTADKGILRHALKNIEFFTGKSEDSFLDKLNENFADSRFDSSAPRLMIKSIVKDGENERFYDPTIHIARDVIHRLCLVRRIAGRGYTPLKSSDFRNYLRNNNPASRERTADTRIPIDAALYSYTSRTGWAFGSTHADAKHFVDLENYNYSVGGDTYSKLDTTVSYVYSVYRYDEDEPLDTTGEHITSYLCLPLAENRITTSETATERGESLISLEDVDMQKRIENIINDIVEQEEEYGNINYLLTNTLAAPAYLEVLRNSIVIKMHQIKPETIQAFSSTKDAIRRAIEALAQDKDNFDHDESETTDNQLEQSQGQSTNPEFSNKAAKMALMTIPMIVKGAAEMFDPNIKIASLIRKGANLSGLDIPPPVASLMGLPFNIIPFAPGPPITPLGLLYLATSFLEPKERKKLSDLKRGKNLNPGADPETGTFAGGTLEEQIERLEQIAILTRERTSQFYNQMATLTKDFAEKLYEAVESSYQDYYDEIPVDDTYFGTLSLLYGIEENLRIVEVPFNVDYIPSGSVPSPPFNDYFAVHVENSGFLSFDNTNLASEYNQIPNVRIDNLDREYGGYYGTVASDRKGFYQAVKSLKDAADAMPSSVSSENSYEITEGYDILGNFMQTLYTAFRDIFHEQSEFRLGHYTWLKFFSEELTTVSTSDNPQNFETLLTSSDFRDARKFYRLYTRLFYTTAYSFFYYGYAVANILADNDLLESSVLDGEDFEPISTGYIAANTIKNDYAAHGTNLTSAITIGAYLKWFNMFGTHIVNREGESSTSSDGLLNDINSLWIATRTFAVASDSVGNLLTVKESPTTPEKKKGAQGLNDRFKSFKNMDFFQQILDTIKEEYD